jgi:D-beta-D-heptose 7-phosphate kinase/D-beta-D-heptose 1-phosphate adenosyltransferase
MNTQRLQQVLAGAMERSAVVLGDVMLDRFIYGRVSRISPEAPVPVVEVSREAAYPGGAANVARNLAPFCREVHLGGLVGEDGAGVELRRLLGEEGVGTGLLQADASHATTVKTRVIARQQQVVRVDRERPQTFGAVERRMFLDKLVRQLPESEALILEDYGKGFFTQELLDELIPLAAGKIIAVDPNPRNSLQWRGVTAIKPNRGEAFAAAGRPDPGPVAHPLEDAALLEVGAILLERWQPKCLLITLGEQGMLLLEIGGGRHHFPSRVHEVFDVSGAGDTAIAVFTAALAGGGTPVEAAELSNVASGIVVEKLGTATLTRAELLERLQ